MKTQIDTKKFQFTALKDLNHELKTPQQLADYLQVPLSWIYSRSRFSHINNFPVIRIGKYTRYKIEDVLAWLEKNQEIG